MKEVEKRTIRKMVSSKSMDQIKVYASYLLLIMNIYVLWRLDAIYFKKISIISFMEERDIFSCIVCISLLLPVVLWNNQYNSEVICFYFVFNIGLYFNSFFLTRISITSLVIILIIVKSFFCIDIPSKLHYITLGVINIPLVYILYTQ
jgi:hypothetical protein